MSIEYSVLLKLRFSPPGPLPLKILVMGVAISFV